MPINSASANNLSVVDDFNERCRLGMIYAGGWEKFNQSDTH